MSCSPTDSSVCHSFNRDSDHLQNQAEQRGVLEGNGEANKTDHYYCVATENAVPQPPRIQGDNKDDMILYGQVEGEGLNGSETYEDPDVEVKVHTKDTNAKISGYGKQNTNIRAKYSKLQQNIPHEPTQWESTPFAIEGHYDVADSRPYQDRYDMILPSFTPNKIK